MTYKITVNNTYSNGDTLTLAFDTNSKLLHDAVSDVDSEILHARIGQGKDPFERAIKSSVTYCPMKDYSVK
jgi:hypothetical protein